MATIEREGAAEDLTGLAVFGPLHEDNAEIVPGDGFVRQGLGRLAELRLGLAQAAEGEIGGAQREEVDGLEPVCGGVADIGAEREFVFPGLHQAVADDHLVDLALECGGARGGVGALEGAVLGRACGRAGGEERRDGREEDGGGCPHVCPGWIGIDVGAEVSRVEGVREGGLRDRLFMKTAQCCFQHEVADSP